MVFACPASSPSTRMDLFSIVVSTVASQHESPTLQSILRCFCMQSACSLCILWFPPTVQKHAWTDHRCEYSSVSPRQPCDRWVTCSPYDIWIVCKHRKQDVSAGLGLSSPEAQHSGTWRCFCYICTTQNIYFLTQQLDKWNKLCLNLCEKKNHDRRWCTGVKTGE